MNRSPNQKVVYLHGFRSGPQSVKAQLLQAEMARRQRLDGWVCPALAVAPEQAIAQLRRLLDACEAAHTCLIGSSLGGYYATFLAEAYGVKAVLLNPAITPQRDLQHYLGVQSVYGSQASIEVKPEFLDQLETLWVERITRPERYFLIAATGDELIDWRLMVDKYHKARQHVIVGSDHGLSNFAELIDEVMDFVDQPLPQHGPR